MELVWSSDRTLLVRDAGALDLFRSLVRAELPGVTGLSPARGSVMVRFDPVRLSHAQVEDWVASLVAVGSEPVAARLVEIPTIYIGEDLAAVAEWSGLTTSEVVDIHASREYEAYFLGFVPGFAYLGEVDSRIAAPRRKSPRTAVPAGSVGIAGGQTGVYPRSTPGGWNLIGRTDIQLFDQNRGVSLIEPGDRVRFVSI